MKIVALADTHGLHNHIDIPDGDVIIFAGDICETKRLESIKEFSRFLHSLPHTHKIIVAGNHDFPFLHSYLLARKYIERVPGAVYLQDEQCIIDGVKFYGSPWTPVFYDWAFMLFSEELKEKWKLIPRDTDVLITHGPPAGVLDLVNGIPAGCPELLKAVQKINPAFHVFGHIHVGYGMTGQYDESTTFINASVCDRVFLPENEPIVFEV